MTTANDARRAHDLLDDLDARAELSQEQEKLLRSFLPERPKQKTLEEIYADVSLTIDRANDANWEDACIYLESWLGELKAQLKGLLDDEPDKPAHPEFLETEEEYANAPVGTVVAEDKGRPVWKPTEHWFINNNPFDNYEISGTPRRVLRWGWES